MSLQNDRSVLKVLESARRRLLETGTRNRLIHVNRANQRANCLNIINEQSDDVFEILRTSGRRMRFKAMGKDKDEEAGQGMLLALPDDTIETGSDRHTDQFLETPLGPEALARRLLRLAGSAKTAEEEQGLNILYLALGFLKWRESPSSEIDREAPLVLLPVELVRNERTSTFDIRAREDDISTNLPLQERLMQDFGIRLPELEEQESWSPSAYFEAVENVIASKPEWSLDRNGMQLGFFSFAKLLMHRDLDTGAWPDGSLTDNPLLAGLLAEGFEADQPIFGPNDKLDTLLDPADIIQVIDADASQTKVIEEVRRGSSLVVQGPPGTGKSQTITNIIAAAVYDGKSVLFVAEKMAALSVVHDRLVRVGLRDICLELHSRTANKKALSQELGRTLAASGASRGADQDAVALRDARDELNRIADLLHQPLGDQGDSPFSAMSEIIGFIGQGANPPQIPLDGLADMSPAERKRAAGMIDRFISALDQVGDPDHHPFRGVDNLDLQPTDLARLEAELTAAVSALSTLLTEVDALAGALGLDSPHTLEGTLGLAQSLRALGAAPDGTAEEMADLFDRAGDLRLSEALKRGEDWQAAFTEVRDDYSASAWNADVGQIRAAVARGQASFWARLFGPYRRKSAELATLVSGSLPKSPRDRLLVVDRLIAVQGKRRHLAEDEQWLQTTLGEHWRGESTPFGRLAALVNWLANTKANGIFAASHELAQAFAAVPDPKTAAEHIERLVETVMENAEKPIARLKLHLDKAGLGESLNTSSISALQERFAEMVANMSGYADWSNLARSIVDVHAAGGAAIADAVSGGSLHAEVARDEFLFACAEARWSKARSMRPELDRLQALDRHELVEVFRNCERDRLSEAKALVLARHFDQVPRGSAGEMGIIRGEIGRKRGHKPIRWVMKNAGAMVQRIKPVMLMSPISVAQFLPPGSVSFDLLVIDEASQVRPEDALGVIARARQIVVVGDQKQLPPTSFFDRLVDDVEDNDDEDEEGVVLGATAADMESILSLCEARGMRSRMLEWHYRSRDPSLIRVSNAEFYGDNLVLPPSPLALDEDYGLKFWRVPGVYARGGSGLGRQGTNKIEAEAVVAAVAAHARNWPELSLGVVTFSKAQADMMTEILELERRRDSVLDNFLRDGKVEDFFVKNIENVQGDERDVIMISVGYGPQAPNGRLNSMSFGPVNGEGGERRLNVLFSRSRVRCEVFASFDPGDIDVSRVKRDGPRVLKRFLDFAKTGIIDEQLPTGLGADSPFEEDVARVIRSLGYEADAQVGSAGFRLDIGVRHTDRPGQYILAVECDGAAYHSALWARERDRLRQDILENLGWRFHRIWSTDWFHRRSQEIERLRQALDAALSAGETGITVRGSNTSQTPFMHETSQDEDVPMVIDHLQVTVPPYRRAEVYVRSSLEPHEAPLPQLVDLIVKVVEIEGPIHVDELARRISAAFGKSRTGSRIMEATRRALSAAARGGADIVKRGDFVMNGAQSAEPPVRDRSAETGSLLKAVYLPPQEIVAAADLLEKESGSMEQSELTRSVARLLGFQRVGNDLSEVIGRHLKRRGAV